MATDLTISIVPAQFEKLVKKAQQDKNYGEWLSAFHRVLRKTVLEDFSYPPQFIFEDAEELRNYYEFSERDFYDGFNLRSVTLDYLLNGVIESENYNIQKDILLKGGNRICENSNLMLLFPEEIERYCSLFQKIKWGDLKKYYDYEKIKAEKIYALNPPEKIEMIESTYFEITSHFQRAQRKKAFVVIDNHTLSRRIEK